MKIKLKLVKSMKWIARPGRKSKKYPVLDNPVSIICSLASYLRRGAKKLCSSNLDSKSESVRLGKDPVERKAVRVPKGHMAVYVGESDFETKRMLVPVMYFNHPLFGELLREAERVYGYNHPGRITIPCRVSDFEKVQMKVAAWEHCRRRS